MIHSPAALDCHHEGKQKNKQKGWDEALYFSVKLIGNLGKEEIYQQFHLIKIGIEGVVCQLLLGLLGSILKSTPEILCNNFIVGTSYSSLNFINGSYPPHK